jgi:hypothetical protein
VTNSGSIDDERDERLRAAVRRDAYSRPLLIDAGDLRARMQERVRVRRVTTVIAFAATSLAAVALVWAVMNVTPPADLGSTATPTAPTNSETSAEPSRTAQTPSIPPLPDLPLFSRDPSGPALDARAEGTLAYDDNGCLVLVMDDAGGTLLLIWPYPGTTWAPEADTVTVDDVDATVGTHIAVGGGGGTSATATEEEWLNPPWQGCWRPERYLVFSMRVLD